jgi:predicted O-methyltransferase YrrM
MQPKAPRSEAQGSLPTKPEPDEVFMRCLRKFILMMAAVFLGVNLSARTLPFQTRGTAQTLDDKVRSFLERHRYQWRDLNVPEADGRLLYDLVLKHGYKRALEIGTSTGHSGIWIAWALSKTGGKLITIEIDEGRHETALANFREAGLADLIDARLGDAHKLVPQLEGSFDFVFCDADKDWYKNYLAAVLPKLEPGGCFAAHNVLQSRWGWEREYLDFARSRSEIETTLDPSSSAGMAISFKKLTK